MKIIFLLRSVVLSGGIERVIVDKANWLAEQGHQILFLTYEQGNHPFSFPLKSDVLHEDLECRYFTVYKRNLFVRPFLKMQMRRLFKDRLKKKIKTFSPDVLVIPHNLSEYLHIITEMNCYIPVVLECHSIHVELFRDTGSMIGQYRRYKFISNLRRCTMIVSLTEADASYWRQFCSKVEVLPNPLPFYNKTFSEVIKKPNRIICVARLQPVKRIDRLIESFALIAGKHADWYIDVFGDGNEREWLTKLIDQKGLQNRIFLNSPVSDIYSEYLQSEFFVLSSDSESFSLAIVEAMACGIPVVSTDCPFGPSDIIEDGVDGLLCKMTVEDLSAKMEWMITHEKERKEMGIKAHQAVARYKKENVMKKWESAYLSVLDK